MKKMPKCIICGKQLTHYISKRCREHNCEFLLKKLQKGLKKYLIKIKKQKIIKKCKQCKKIFKVILSRKKTAVFCSKKCHSIYARFDLKRADKIRKAVIHQKIEHHIDADATNNMMSNKLKIDASKHRQLHEYSYRYLVEIGLIDKYIKWFDNKYGLK